MAVVYTKLPNSNTPFIEQASFELANFFTSLVETAASAGVKEIDTNIRTLIPGPIGATATVAVSFVQNADDTWDVLAADTGAKLAVGVAAGVAASATAAFLLPASVVGGATVAAIATGAVVVAGLTFSKT